MSDVEAGIAGTLAGTVLGFLLSVLHGWMDRNRRQKSHWLMLRAEFNYCAEQAKAFIDAGIKAPLWRMPTETYRRAYPELTLTTSEARALSEFYLSVDQVNRGLDQAHAAARANEQVELLGQHDRNVLKARRLIVGGEYYVPANAVLLAHFV
jgi:hypothetical protein